jgi:hypothetical protein
MNRSDSSPRECIDIILVYHGLSYLPIDQFVFVNNIVLFNTNDNIKYKNNKLPNMADLERAVLLARQNYQSTANRYTPAIVRLS